MSIETHVSCIIKYSIEEELFYPQDNRPALTNGKEVLGDSALGSVLNIHNVSVDSICWNENAEVWTVSGEVTSVFNRVYEAPASVISYSDLFNEFEIYLKTDKSEIKSVELVDVRAEQCVTRKEVCKPDSFSKFEEMF